MKPNDMYWLAGLLEGEGSFLKPAPSAPNSPIVCVQMTDEDVIARASSLMGCGYYSSQPANPKHKRTYITRVRGERAVRLMQLLRPLMGERRQAQIDRALPLFKAREPGKFTDKKKTRALKLRKDGKSYREIAEALEINHVTIYKFLHTPVSSNGRTSVSNSENVGSSPAAGARSSG